MPGVLLFSKSRFFSKSRSLVASQRQRARALCARRHDCSTGARIARPFSSRCDAALRSFRSSDRCAITTRSEHGFIADRVRDRHMVQCGARVSGGHLGRHTIACGRDRVWPLGATSRWSLRTLGVVASGVAKCRHGIVAAAGDHRCADADALHMRWDDRRAQGSNPSPKSSFSLGLCGPDHALGTINAPLV